MTDVASDQIYWACADALVLAVQLPAAASLPPASELQQRLMTLLDGIVAKGRKAGVPDVELAEARYALTAFMDEQILKSNWPGRAEWMNQPLQLQLYREFTAGENFFKRPVVAAIRIGGIAVLAKIVEHARDDTPDTYNTVQ